LYHTSRSCGAGEVATEHIEVNSLIKHDRAQRRALGKVNSSRAPADEQ
jgi:hypothetical protein